MSARDDAIRVMQQHRPMDTIPGECLCGWSDGTGQEVAVLGHVLDAMAPIIRTDEQMRAEPINQAWRDKMESRIRADERSKFGTDSAFGVLLDEARAGERERIADLMQTKFGLISARGHDSGCVCSVCILTRMMDDIVDWLKKGGSDD